MRNSIVALLHVLLFSRLVAVAASTDLVSRGEHKYSPYASNLTRWPHGPHGTRGASGTLIDNERNKYVLPITVGGQTLNLEIDTGSSDTWLIQSGYECYYTFDNSSQTFTESENSSFCNWTSTFTPTEDFAIIPNLHQLTCYGSGVPTRHCMYGPLGYSNVTINGLEVPHQIIGAPNESSNPLQGLPDYSGIIGLGFSGGTMAHKSSTNATVQYPSIMETLFNTSTFAAPHSKKFSFALSRDASSTGYGGVLTIGGIPSLTHPTINASSTFTSTPIEIYANTSTTQYSWYNITLEGFDFGERLVAPNTTTIIDSGYNGLEIPSEVATMLNNNWSPPGNVSGSTIFLDCNAVLSSAFGVRIGGATYYIDSADLVGQMTNGSCYSLVIAGFPPNGYSVGDPFLRNALAVFDWGEMVISFYPRVYYQS
ncbi:hypothetical protein LTR10_021942 [Elasticomyces elasticus]|uniref:Peptidase A1 domain-containing protein n=1 Tax=Exophiala sideris TaxID=1016849 RepID=A0ABR0JEP2_9EURO|nr:hypothetical protein LTR10_021942 [Elasticomyces elasticus]KAK5032794.1 hypothetical protein LTS07_004204 [Exophiala sideris]KAK5037025.1 hypothetical protein LTR13_004830 [Exophiala sideris]KAK5062318.1 hypothetical protein LTR69_004676 [Exophiala sideris]KAK5182183.1 hypothetical protein LTR44_005194 [Eurotiomycetes sp. CCFEE 6388]